MLLSRCHRAVFETPIHAFSPLFSPALHEGSSDKLETVWEMDAKPNFRVYTESVSGLSSLRCITVHPAQLPVQSRSLQT
eukprot:s2890_g6.t1